MFQQNILIGHKNLVVTTIRDMSYHFDLEKERNMTMMKTLAFAQAAHEFRNPLNAIMTSLDLLKSLVDLNS